MIIFGTGGIFAERAVTQILSRKASTFHEALIQSTKGVSPILAIGVYIVFLVPAFLFGISKRVSSPLLTSILVTMVWAIVLYVFLAGIFPSL